MADIAAVTIGGRETHLPASAVDDLASGLRGELIRPGDRDHEPARRIWNAMIDRRPALVARCAGARGRGRRGQLRPRQRAAAGGARRRARRGARARRRRSRHRPDRYESGGGRCRGADSPRSRDGDANRWAYALGGIGHLRRKHGLSCGNLVSAQLVTAEGSLLTASDTRVPSSVGWRAFDDAGLVQESAPSIAEAVVSHPA